MNQKLKSKEKQIDRGVEVIGSERSRGWDRRRRVRGINIDKSVDGIIGNPRALDI